MNLRPVTAYLVKVQLTRPGNQGEGAMGPQTIMVTDCQGEYLMVSESNPGPVQCKRENAQRNKIVNVSLGIIGAALQFALSSGHLQGVEKGTGQFVTSSINYVN